MRHSDRAAVRDDPPHHRNGRLVGGLRESDVVAHAHDLASLRQRANHLWSRSGLLDSVAQGRRSERLPAQKLDQCRGGPVNLVQLHTVFGQSNGSDSLGDEAILKQALDHRRESAGRHAEPVAQLLARDAGTQRVRGVIGAELPCRAVGDRAPRSFVEEPIADAPRVQSRHIRLGRHGGLQQRRHGDPARIFAQLLLKDVAGRAPFETVPHDAVVARVAARGDVDERSAGDCRRRAWDAQDQAIALRRGDRPLQVELHPALGAGRDLV